MHGLSLAAGSRDYSLVAVHSLLVVLVSFIAEHRLYGKRASVGATRGLSSVGPRLQSTGSIVAAHGLSCSAACRIFPDQGSNIYLLYWQDDSLPLSHRGSPSS